MNNSDRHFLRSSPIFSKIFNSSLLCLTAFSIVVLFLFTGLAIGYATTPYLSDHVDGHVAAVSWLLQQGQPLYHSLEAAERYSTQYGPNLYLIIGFFLKLLGPNLIVAKLPSVLALIFSLVLLFLILQTTVKFPLSAIGTACTSLSILAFGNTILNTAFQIRSDALLLLCVVLGFWGIKTHKSVLAWFLCALGFGVAINLKVTAIVYFFPLYILFFSQYGFGLTLGSVLAGLMIAVLPFALPQISLENYLLWIDRTKNHGLSLQQFWENLRTALVLFLPLGLLSLQLWVSDRRAINQLVLEYKSYFYALLIGVFGTVLVAAKPGAGIHHLLPYLPFIIYICCLEIVAITETFSRKKRQLNRGNPLNNATFFAIYSILFLIFLRCAVWQGVFLFSNYYGSFSHEVVADIQQVIQSYPKQTIEIGYAGNKTYFFTEYRSIPVFTGNPYLIDSTALMDMQKAGLEIPASTIEVLHSCQIKIWLIPQGEIPFTLSNYYPPNLPLFSDEFQAAFKESYEMKHQSQYYDLWFCKSE
jgi:4-amino-4-deoxy-L-arabinose transferase-like glycosyltransferase